MALTARRYDELIPHPRVRARKVLIAVLADQSWRRVRNGWLRPGHSLASMRPVAIMAVAALTLGSVAAVGHELGSAGRPPEVGSSIDRSSAAVLRYLATQPPGGVITTDALGILGVRDDRRPGLDRPLQTGPRTGASGRVRADWLFGVYHGTPVQPWIAALFIADTGAATGSRRAGPPPICGLRSLLLSSAPGRAA